ncbi:cobalt-precorrin 5A hydrolase [Kyrpidia tusciae]|uniref:Cobalamin (Vitamin B12) biosynthesis CbiG protein n=1 Tax=Kyrpidia tusciae (strain DSM 2912 / NBRC 15312 / T2) TaxID=562970 RepID=D5WT74_KYRT2|nr:cobalamin biosynthesis protein [Kyrpidia tusciae]ADG05178.1 cobalamin (vitamin B12) biosynthesis CbiG protein [Kyrpidia tusciae DSM 2912]
MPWPDHPQAYAAVAITKHGVELAWRTAKGLGGVDVYCSEKFDLRAAGGAQEGETFSSFRATPFSGSVRELLQDGFHRYEGWILFISLGAVVRMIAPVLRDKKTDPAVVVVDDAGRFAISVLSGHLGGANRLAERVAEVLGAQPVITTASDVGRTIAVDLLGRSFGWTLADDRHVTPASAAVVNEEPVLVLQEAGERGWWTRPTPLPPTIHRCDSLEEARGTAAERARQGLPGFGALLLITDRIWSEEELRQFAPYWVVYRPKSLILGIGCNRGTPRAEIEEVVEGTLRAKGLAVDSVAAVATIDRKKDEAGLVAMCRDRGWPLIAYTPDELNEMPMRHPSETVYRYTGAYGVSEPAAMRAAGTDRLLVDKIVSGNVTLSVARKAFNAREGAGEGGAG